MLSAQGVSNHYRHGDLIQAIENALADMGKSRDELTIDDLASVDEFHIGGRKATINLLNQMDINKQQHLLDVGCGLGGAARYVTSSFNNQVTGIDVTQEYITTGNVLCQWVNLGDKVSLLRANALALPFTPEKFDGAYMLHVGMNIEHKEKLFSELYRVLSPDSRLAIYDIMQIEQGDLAFPMPWASTAKISHLESLENYKSALRLAGFEVITYSKRGDFALDFYQQLSEKWARNGGPEPLGLHTLMQQSAAIKLKNMVDAIKTNLICPIEIIAQKC